jgi:hypothetical protein
MSWKGLTKTVTRVWMSTFMRSLGVNILLTSFHRRHKPSSKGSTSYVSHELSQKLSLLCAYFWTCSDMADMEDV